MKPGDTFTHSKWLGADKQPLLCVITKIAQGVVYWKAAGSPGKAKDFFPLSDARKYVKAA
jgi:hypothetical protein